MRLNTKHVAGFFLFALLLVSCKGGNDPSDIISENSIDSSRRIESRDSNIIGGDTANSSEKSDGVKNSVVEERYTITWKNWNGIVLEIDNNVKKGVIPTYDGATPKRPDDSEYKYTWNGWNPEVKIATANQVYTATYSHEPLLHVLSVISEDTSKGSVAITSGNGYSGESITVVATPIGDCVFRGWYHNDTKVSDEQTYTFSMPSNDYSLVAHFITKAEEEEEELRRLGCIPTFSEDGKTVTYGLYPQNNVDDPSLVSSLESLTVPETNGCYLYNNDYYAKIAAAPYASNYKFDNGITIVNGTTYWFKCEPITWNVLSSNNGDFYLLSSVLLDAHCYHKDELNRTIDEKLIYPNNYEFSDIRAWLNDDFYNSAFALNDSFVQTTTVDNSASTTDSTSNSYACNNTQDKVFLPSYKDYINGSYGFSTSWFSSTNTRYCKTTDWARARGAQYYSSIGGHAPYEYNGYYWTRSPGSAFSFTAFGVFYDGYMSSGDDVYEAFFSVRPSLWIHVE